MAIIGHLDCNVAIICGVYVYTIVSMKTSGFSGWLMVKRSIQSKWAGVAYAIEKELKDDE